MGLKVLGLSHWARSVRAQNAIVCVDGGRFDACWKGDG